MYVRVLGCTFCNMFEHNTFNTCSYSLGPLINITSFPPSWFLFFHSLQFLSGQLGDGDTSSLRINVLSPSLRSSTFFLLLLDTGIRVLVILVFRLGCCGGDVR